MQTKKATAVYFEKKTQTILYHCILYTLCKKFKFFFTIQLFCVTENIVKFVSVTNKVKRHASFLKTVKTMSILKYKAMSNITASFPVFQNISNHLAFDPELIVIKVIEQFLHLNSSNLCYSEQIHNCISFLRLYQVYQLVVVKSASSICARSANKIIHQEPRCSTILGRKEFTIRSRIRECNFIFT